MILVTGATGFLGHNLVPRLVKAGHGVRVLARPSSDTTFLESHGVEVAHTPDIADTEAAIKACKGCEAVIHMAAHFRMWGPLTHFWQTNVEGTATMLEAATQAGVQRFVHVSTVVVAGKTYPGRVVTEDHPCQPQDNYQRTKVEGEKLAFTYFKERGLPVIILRPGALYGPWGRYAFNRLFFEEPLRNWRIRVAGGKHITFPAFTPDVAQGIIAALTKGRPGEAYNLSGQSHDHNSINNVVSDLAGISRWRMDIPVFAVLLLARLWTGLSRFTRREPFYPINLAHYVFQDWDVSSDKAIAELDFNPTPFEEGAKATLDWYHKIGFLKKGLAKQ